MDIFTELCGKLCNNCLDSAVEIKVLGSTNGLQTATAITVVMLLASLKTFRILFIVKETLRMESSSKNSMVQEHTI